MKKSRNSVKGEYGIGYAFSAPVVRDFQELLNCRMAQQTAFSQDGPEHKMEFVKSFRDVDFVNDSASTNVNGLYLALSEATKQVTWITSFTAWDDIDVSLLQLIVEKVNMIVYLGEENAETHRFLDALNVRYDRCEDMETAVRIAFYGSSAGQEVLFSPGVPAGIEYDDDIAVRGDEFKSAVAQL